MIRKLGTIAAVAGLLALTQVQQPAEAKSLGSIVNSALNAIYRDYVNPYYGGCGYGGYGGYYNPYLGYYGSGYGSYYGGLGGYYNPYMGTGYSDPYYGYYSPYGFGWY
jgi:hypothetical protein